MTSLRLKEDYIIYLIKKKKKTNYKIVIKFIGFRLEITPKAAVIARKQP